MDEIVTQRFIRNVTALARDRGVGRMETECGVKQGYLRRAELSKTRGISMITALRMARWLGYSLEDLTTKEIWKEKRLAEISEELKTLT